MKIAVVYCYPMVESVRYFSLAKRFTDTMRQFPPGETPYDLHVMCNGASPTENDKQPFSGIPCAFYAYNNIGWDIGAFQWAADSIQCDMMVCLGAPIHFYRAGWLDRMAWAFINHSPGLFGCTGIALGVQSHIRTTAFWFQPELLRQYPFMVGSMRESRYDFEHGPVNSFTNFANRSGYDPTVVTFDAVYPMSQWGNIDGSVGKCIVLDQHNHP